MTSSLLVVLVGASSSGKTTLAQRLCESSAGLNLKVVTETARTLLLQRGIRREELQASLDSAEKTLFIQLQHDIVTCQDKLERKHEEEGTSIVSDRSALDALVYLSLNVGEKALKKLLKDNPATKRCLQRYTRSLVVLVSPWGQIIDDGVRLVRDLDQNKFTKRTRELCHDLGIPYLDLDCTDLSERVDVVKKALTQGIHPFRAERASETGLRLVFTPLVKIGRRRHRHRQQQQHAIANSVKQKKIRTFVLTESQVKAEFTELPIGFTNRIVDRYGADSIVMLSFDEEICAQQVHKMLIRDVVVDGETFNFFGCSSSGLKARKCVLWKGSGTDVEAILRENGEFHRLKTVSKRMARIGLLFSNCRMTVPVENQNVATVPDIETSDGAFNFTDGCGNISRDLAKTIFGASVAADCSGGEANGADTGFVPSVLQIRYQGCKGIVCVDSRLTARESNTRPKRRGRGSRPEKMTQLQLRPSMIKFESDSHPVVGLVGYSRPYTFGNLNRQFITLLSAGGVPDEVFLNKQSEFYEMLAACEKDVGIAVEILQWMGRFDLAHTAVAAAARQDDAEAVTLIHRELRRIRRRLLGEPERLRFLVKKSRNVYGIADDRGLLKYNECFFRPTIRGVPKTLRCLVVVAKNPCYLRGDVRVLQAVDTADRPEIVDLERDLVDAIVFPTQGPRPHPNEIAGSDLDGDQYFVCWDQDLIPTRRFEPYDYPDANSRSLGQVNKATMVSYFAHQNRSKQTVGRIDRYYKHWADREGAGSTRCERLGQLFARAIDAAKTGEDVVIPKSLRPPPPETDSEPHHPSSQQQCKYVWQVMAERGLLQRTKMQSELLQSSSSLLSSSSSASGDDDDNDEVGPSSLSPQSLIFAEVSIDVVWDLVLNHEACIDEFRIFDFVFSWIASVVLRSGDGESEAMSLLLEFADFIDFGQFSLDQQKQAITAGVPRAIVLNALNKSRLLKPQMRQRFQLDLPHFRWRLWHRATHDMFEWNYLLKALTQFDQSLIVLQLPDGVTIALHFLQRCKLGISSVDPGTLVAYFFSNHFGYHLRFIVGPGYEILLEEQPGMFQLYEGKPQNTFVWLKGESLEKLERRQQLSSRVDGGGTNLPNPIFFDRISVDLNRFKSGIYAGTTPHPKIRKTRFGSIEVFVQDVNSVDRLCSPYFDSHIVGEVPKSLPELGDSDSSDEEAEDDDADVPVVVVDDDGVTDNCHALDDDELVLLMKAAASEGSAVKFSRLAMEALGDGDDLENERQDIHLLAESAIESLVALLKSLDRHRTVRHCPLSDMVRSATEAAASVVFEHVRKPIDMIAIAALSTKLGLPHLSSQLVTGWTRRRPTGPVQLNLHDFMNAAEQWRHWCLLSHQDAILLLDWMYEQCSLDHQQQSHREAPIALLPSVVSLAEMSAGLASDGALQDVDSGRVHVYALRWTRLLVLSIVGEMDAVRQSLSCSTNSDSCLMNLRVDPAPEDSDNADDEGVVSMFRTGALGFSKLTRGLWVALSRTRDQRLNPGIESCAAFAQISSMCHAPPSIELELHNADDDEFMLPEALRRCSAVGGKNWKWRIDGIANVTNFERCMKALRRATVVEEFEDAADAAALLLAKVPLLPIIVHPNAAGTGGSQINSNHADSWSDRRAMAQDDEKSQHLRNSAASSTGPSAMEFRGDDVLNQSQACAVKAAISQRLTLIHGPPGSGKTTVACECILKAVSDSKRVLVVCQTNAAVDNIARRLIQTGKLLVVRLGNEAQIASDLFGITLDGHMQKRDQQSGKSSARRRFRDQRSCTRILKSAEVVCTTCSGCGDPLLAKVVRSSPSTNSFDFSLIDEATLATEPSTLMALVYGCRQLVLIGDPNQLSPVVVSSSANNQIPAAVRSDGGCGLLFDSAKHLPSIDALSTTMFHRLHTNIPSQFLNRQHRMHPALSSFPSQAFYNGRLLDGVSAADRAPPRFPWPDPKRPVCFVNVADSREHRVGRSFGNRYEANVVHDVVQALLKGGLSPLDIGVLLPYAGQVGVCRQCLGSSAQRVEVCSIDGFQGREKEVIIFSSVRSNSNGALGFTDDPNRVNVLLTRARRGLVGIGHEDTLRAGSSLWSSWLDQAPVLNHQVLQQWSSSSSSLSGKSTRSRPPRPPRRDSKNEILDTTSSSASNHLSRSDRHFGPASRSGRRSRQRGRGRSGKTG